MTADIVCSLNDVDELAASGCLGSSFYLAMLRLIIFSSHQKDMLYVVETMRKDWACSSYEDRVILKKKCLFAFRLSKWFIIMVIGTVTSFSCLPILEVCNNIFNIFIIYNIQASLHNSCMKEN